MSDTCVCKKAQLVGVWADPGIHDLGVRIGDYCPECGRLFTSKDIEVIRRE